MGNKALDYQKEQDARMRALEEARKLKIQEGIRDVDTTFAQLLNPHLKDSLSSQYRVVPNAPDPRGIAKNGLYGIKDPSGNIAKYFTSEADAFGHIRGLNGGNAQGGLTPDFENSTFLDNLQRSFLGFATPEVNRQGVAATEKSAKQLARRGTGESSIAARQESEIARQRGEALQRIAARGEEIRSQRATDIERARSGIIGQLETTGNSAAAAQAAINSAANLSGSQEFSPLGNLFNTGLRTGSDVLKLQSQPGASPTIFSRGKKGSQKVIS
jgi:hypothetical protein